MAVVPKKIWLVANFKETQLAGMKAGQPVTFTVDALKHASFSGHIERFSPATGSEFSVLKADNAHRQFHEGGTARAGPDCHRSQSGSSDRLAPGMSVTVSIDTKTNTAKKVASMGDAVIADMQAPIEVAAEVCKEHGPAQ